MLSVHGLVEKLIDLLEDPIASTSSLMAIGHIIAGNDVQAQRVLDFGVLSKLVSMISLF